MLIAFSLSDSSLGLRCIVKEGFLGFLVSLSNSSILGTPLVTLDLLATPAI